MNSEKPNYNPECNCPATDCPNHGYCVDCVKTHRGEGKKIVFCLRAQVPE